MKMNNGIIAIAAIMLLGAGCTVSAPSPTAGNVPSAVIPTSISARLDLSGRGLERVPSDVFNRTELQELDISKNRLTGALPAEIRHLWNLRVLNASGNEMTGVPAEMGQLLQLRDLNLSDNKLTGLPLELGNLSNLQLLDLRGNDIAKQDLDTIRAKLKNTQILE